MAEMEDAVRSPEPTFPPLIRPKLDNNRAGASSPEPNCAICLGQLKNISYTDKCLHRFCFACIQEWSKIKQECPLCKQNFSSIIHNVRSENDYDRCNVANPSIHEAWNQLLQAYRQGMERNRQHRNRMDLQLRNIQFNGVTFMNRSEVNLPIIIPLAERRDPRFRARVYREMLYSAALRNRTGIPRESSPEFYRSNPAELGRLETFFSRELGALLSGPSARDAMRSVKLELQISSIRSPAFHGILRYYLDNTRAFIFRHELYNFAVSGYDVVGYDKYVKYYPHGVIGVPSRSATNRNYLPEILQREGVQDEAPDVQELGDEFDDIEEIADTDNTPPIHLVRNIPTPSRDVITISDSNSDSDDCEIVQVVRPQDRIVEVIELYSDEDSVHVIESSPGSSSNSDSDFNIDTEENQSVVAKEEHEPRVDYFNLPSTSQQSDSQRSYTPPLVLDLSMPAENCHSPQNQIPKIEVHDNHQQELPVTLKRSRSDDSSDSNSSIDSMPSRTRRRKRVDLRNRIASQSESSSSEDCDSSSPTRHRPLKRRRRQLQRRFVSSSSSMSDSSECHKHCSRSISSSEDDKKERKRKLKRSKRERHGESSSKSRKTSQDKKSKKRKKRRSSKHRDSKHDSKHRRSEKKSSRRSY